MRKPIIVGNWKMNKTIAATKAFVEAVDPEVTDKADWGIATPYLALQTAKAGAKNLIVAAENVHFKDSGAYTGEVSVEMLKEIGVEWVILGHSERRQYFGETDETVNAKMLQVLKNDMTPIVCVGETLEQYEAGTTKDVVKTQVVAAYKDVCDFAEIVPLSALKDKNTDVLLEQIFKYLPYGPQFYDEDTVTDQPMRQIAAELIREKALRLLDDEIPHGIAVVIEQMKERPNGIIDIEASIVCERESHKGIIIGKGGSMLKKIGTVARREIENMMETKVNLQLWVKVRKEWRDSELYMKNYGYNQKDV